MIAPLMQFCHLVDMKCTTNAQDIFAVYSVHPDGGKSTAEHPVFLEIQTYLIHIQCHVMSGIIICGINTLYSAFKQP